MEKTILIIALFFIISCEEKIKDKNINTIYDKESKKLKDSILVLGLTEYKTYKLYSVCKLRKPISNMVGLYKYKYITDNVVLTSFYRNNVIGNDESRLLIEKGLMEKEIPEYSNQRIDDSFSLKCYIFKDDKYITLKEYELNIVESEVRDVIFKKYGVLDSTKQFYLPLEKKYEDSINYYFYKELFKKYKNNLIE